MKKARAYSLRGARRLLSREEGFSLTELLVAMAVMLVVLVAAYGVWFGLQRTYGFVDEDTRAQNEASMAMTEMREYIRTAREPDFFVAEDLDLVIVRAEHNALVCWTDVDRDEYHDLELIRFRVDQENRALYRDTSQDADLTTATQVRLVGSWVSNTDEEGKRLFSYVGMNGSIPAMTEGTEEDPSHVVDPTQIREIRILLMVDVEVGSAPEHHELSDVVQPRNLRSY